VLGQIQQAVKIKRVEEVIDVNLAAFLKYFNFEKYIDEHTMRVINKSSSKNRTL